MNISTRKKLDEAQRLLAEVEQEIAREVEALLPLDKGAVDHWKRQLMFASIELGSVAAVRKALEAV